MIPEFIKRLICPVKLTIGALRSKGTAAGSKHFGLLVCRVTQVDHFLGTNTCTSIELLTPATPGRQIKLVLVGIPSQHLPQCHFKMVTVSKSNQRLERPQSFEQPSCTNRKKTKEPYNQYSSCWSMQTHWPWTFSCDPCSTPCGKSMLQNADPAWLLKYPRAVVFEACN